MDSQVGVLICCSQSLRTPKCIFPNAHFLVACQSTSNQAFSSIEYSQSFKYVSLDIKYTNQDQSHLRFTFPLYHSVTTSHASELCRDTMSCLINLCVIKSHPNLMVQCRHGHYKNAWPACLLLKLRTSFLPFLSSIFCSSFLLLFYIKL